MLHSCTLKDKMKSISSALSSPQPVVFTSGEVRRLVGATQRQLSYWDVSTLASPHGRGAQGSGSRRLYTLLDVLELKLIRRLREAGLSLQKIRQALIILYELSDDPAPLAELDVLTDGHRVLIRRSDEQLLDPLAQQFVLRFPLADLLAEIQAQVPPQPSRDGRYLGVGIPVGVQRP
jgi:DNA-binding transcriptional MerR regulator